MIKFPGGLEMNGKEKPIGYWLKAADLSITAKVNENLAQFKITRFHWQVLNTIKDHDMITKAQILGTLKNFLDENRLEEILRDFTERKWIYEEARSGTITIQLTEEGKKAYEEILAKQQQTRMQLFAGLTMEDYETTIKVLKKVVENAKKM